MPRSTHLFGALLFAVFLPSGCADVVDGAEQVTNARGASAILIAIHGAGEGEDPTVWANALVDTVRANTDSVETWEFVAYDWSARSDNTLTASNAGVDEGQRLGLRLAELDFDHVHFIGHSVGALVVENAIGALGADRRATVHATFLDPFGLLGADYGAGADFAEAWINTDDGAPGSDTALTNAFNVDVTAAKESSERAHWWPIDAYLSTVQARGVPGFGTTAEASGFRTTLHAEFPRGDTVEFSAAQ